MTKTLNAGSSRHGFLDNWKIKSKVLSGFGAVLIISAIAGAVSFYEFRGINDDVSRINQRTDTGAMANEIERNFLLYRGVVRDYLGTGKEALIAEAEVPAKVVVERGKELLKKLQVPSRVKLTEEILAAFQVYDQGLQSMVAMTHEQQKLMSEVIGSEGESLLKNLETMITARNAATGGELDQATSAALSIAVRLQLTTRKAIETGLEVAQRVHSALRLKA